MAPTLSPSAKEKKCSYLISALCALLYFQFFKLAYFLLRSFSYAFPLPGMNESLLIPFTLQIQVHTSHILPYPSSEKLP